MSKEYIERRKVSNACYEVFEDIVRQPKLFTAEEVWQELLRFERAINSVPTANVVEVKHGRWKYYRKQNIAVCTNCSFERKLDDDFGKAVSCPNCGADMRGGNDGEK